MRAAVIIAAATRKQRRNLERQLGTIARKVAARIATSPPAEVTHGVDAGDVRLSGPARFRKELAFRTSRPGVATVSWTKRGETYFHRSHLLRAKIRTLSDGATRKRDAESARGG